MSLIETKTQLSHYYITPVHDKPISMLLDYVESMNVSDPIILTIDLPPLPSTPLSAYFVFYFAAFSSNWSDTRTMQIYINGQEKSTLTVEHDSSKVVSIYPMDIMGLKINITLVATNQSTLPPILNGIEIFTNYKT